MEKIHKDILTANRAELVENIHPKDGLFTQLIARKVLSQRMVRTIQHGKSPDQQNEELLDTLQRRGPEAFDLFCEALIADDQKFIVDKYLKIEGKVDKNDNIEKSLSDSQSVGSSKSSVPMLVSVREDGDSQFNIKCFAESGEEKRSQSFTLGDLKAHFKDHEARYLLKHFLSESGTSSTNITSQIHPSKRQSCSPPQLIPQRLSQDTIIINKAESFHRADSLDTLNKPQFIHMPNETTEIEQPVKKKRTDEWFPKTLMFDDTGIDLTDGPVDVMVEMSSRQFYMTNYRQSYSMKKIPRGLALIINVNEVSGKSPRRGTDIDRDNLHNLFCQLHFDVIVYNDRDGLNAKDVISKLQEFTSLEEHNEAECCVICLLSHGEEGFIFGTDGRKILLNDIFSMFDNINCRSLIGKPKLFIIQACRGGSFDRGSTYTASDEIDGHDNSPDRMFHLPTMSDMLICYPTQMGYYAWRNRERGSWYIEAVVQVFMKYAKNEDLCAMLNRVNNVVSKKVSNSPSVEMDQMTQMSEYKSTLRMPHLFLFPGIGCG